MSVCLYSTFDPRNISAKENPLYIKILNSMLKVNSLSHAKTRIADLSYLIELRTGSYRCACKIGYSGDGRNCFGEPVNVNCAPGSFQRLSVSAATSKNKSLLNSTRCLYM